MVQERRVEDTGRCRWHARLGVERRNDAEEGEQQGKENQDGQLAPGSMGDRHCLLQNKKKGGKGYCYGCQCKPKQGRRWERRRNSGTEMKMRSAGRESLASEKQEGGVYRRGREGIRNGERVETEEKDEDEDEERRG